jgi:diguanylate cyclase (GGDEF)-like protein/PAS domain S-box-containing protein
VFGRAIDAPLVKEISASAGLDVRFILPERLPPPSLDITVERDGIGGDVVGRMPLRDRAGQAIFVAETREPRAIFSLGLDAVVKMVILSAIIFVVLLVVARQSLAALFLKPLRELELSLDREGDVENPLEDAIDTLSVRPDLVGRTARIIKRAREALMVSLAAEQHRSRLLDEEVRARTSELSRSNHDLQIFKRIIEETGEGIVITDTDGNIIDANRSFCESCGYPLESLIGKNHRIMKSGRHDVDFYKSMWETLLATGRWTGEIWDLRSDGNIFPKLLSLDTIRDAEGRTECYVGISSDISKLKDVEERLSRIAFFDTLTGLPNRALFQDRYRQEIARAQRSGTRVALLYLDLDRFKLVNDSLGHLAGDEVLRGVSSRVAAQIRATDSICRLGGDEFALILPSISRYEDLEMISRKIIAAVGEPFGIAGNEIFVGASIGIAIYPTDGADGDQLIKLADTAMYEAKESGGGQYAFVSSLTGKEHLKRIEIEAGLRHGMERGEFFLQFQPQTSVGGAARGSSGGIIGAEALVRWRNASGAVIPPDEFISIAEETGLIVRLGEIVLRDACREALRWAAAGFPLPVSVNVSQRQFEQGRIVLQVKDALELSGLPPELLKLEVTESLFMRDLEKSSGLMREILGMGVTFAVDDFGTGYSSLRYIDILPIACLKIDKSFVQRITQPSGGVEIAAAVTALARSFGLVSIAEGVETLEQLEALRALGCDAIQGYFVSKPLGADDFMAFLERGRVPEAPETRQV